MVAEFLWYSGSKDAELINDYIKKGLIVPGEITINLLLKKIRVLFLEFILAAQFYESQGQKKIIIDGFPRSMENLEGWEKLVGDQVDVTDFTNYITSSSASFSFWSVLRK